MKCEYKDGLTVKYTGPLQVTKGKEINILIKEEAIPEDIQLDLDMALFKDSCVDMRAIADTVQKTYGNRACIH